MHQSCFFASCMSITHLCTLGETISPIQLAYLITIQMVKDKYIISQYSKYFLFFSSGIIEDHDLSIQIRESTLNGSTNIKELGVSIYHKLNW